MTTVSILMPAAPLLPDGTVRVRNCTWVSSQRDVVTVYYLTVGSGRECSLRLSVVEKPK